MKIHPLFFLSCFAFPLCASTVDNPLFYQLQNQNSESAENLLAPEFENDSFHFAAKYQKNPSISDEVWTNLESYFLPEDHPIKKQLDKIFSKSRALASNKAMKKAGFKLFNQPKNKLVVAKHPKLKGYIVKAYLDPMPTTDWIWWKKRIDGSRLVQQGIDLHGYQSMFKVPKKWIYPLPPEPSSNLTDVESKNFILIVENMHILNEDKNYSAFKKKITKEHLNALYTLIQENKLIDSVYIDNIPFCKDGKIAFIDIEHFNDTTQPVEITRLAQYFSKEMYSYWEQLIQRGVQN